MCPRHGRRPDDRSPSPDGPGSRAFGRRIRRTSFPQRFRPSTNIAKYIDIWLEDFWLAYRAKGVDDDLFIIQYLSIYVGEHVRVWLEFLPHDSIHYWANLKRVFVRNFQGTYVRPGNS